MYHYVRPDSDGYPYFKHLHLEDFKKQLDYFEKEIGFVSQADFLNSLKSKTPVQGVILTFDDGLKDHYLYVLPELVKRGLWGIFYVCTGIYQTPALLDVHKVHLLLGKYGGKKILEILSEKIADWDHSDEYKSKFQFRTYNNQSNDKYTTEAKRILNYYIGCGIRGTLLNEMMTELFDDEDKLVNTFYLSKNEMVEMEAAGMLIGSHSVNHPVMSKLSLDEQKLEISNSFDWLDKNLVKPPFRSFSYPFGGDHTFTNDTINLLENHYCEFSFNVEPRDITAEDLVSRKQALSRYDCNLFPYGKVRI